MILLVLNISCAPSPTTMPTTAPTPRNIQVAIATATQVVLPTQNALPTDIVIPTITQTSTPTRIPSPTSLPTPSPTESLKPLSLPVYRTFNFNEIDNTYIGTGKLYQGFQIRHNPVFTNENSGVRFEPDSTGLFNGKVIHAKITGTPPEEVKQLGGAHRAYFEFFSIDHPEGNFAFEFSLVVMPTKEKLGFGGNAYDVWYSPSSFSVLCTDSAESMVAGINLYNDEGAPYFRPYIIDKNNKSIPVTTWRKAIYKFGEKVRLREEVFRNADGKPIARFYLNGQFFGESQLRDDATTAIGRVRGGGIYAGNPTRDLETFSGDWVLYR